ncbi:MAG: hypothetical protein V3S68_09830 [Dehalococcoidia bacterium]
MHQCPRCSTQLVQVADPDIILAFCCVCGWSDVILHKSPEYEELHSGPPYKTLPLFIPQPEPVKARMRSAMRVRPCAAAEANRELARLQAAARPRKVA